MAAARESLSPLIRNTQARRLSFELCQRVGNHLLSPSSPNWQNGNVFSSPDSHKPENPFGAWCSTPTRRGSSPCISTNSNIQKQLLGSEAGKIHPLTPTATKVPVPRIEIQEPAESWKANVENGLTKEVQNWNCAHGPGGQEPTIIAEKLTPWHDAGEDKENKEPVQHRRKSSSSAYFDFGESSYLDLVSAQHNLQLNPGETLGRGSFGIVISGFYKGQEVAVKIINTKTSCSVNSLEGERIALGLPPHQNVIRILEIIQSNSTGDPALVLMEKLRPGNLLTIINDNNAILDMKTCLQISAQITAGLLHCHNLGILHLDVKPQNILIDGSGRNCKLSDFGNAKRMKDFAKIQNFLKLDGTIMYKAPELFRGFCPSEKCDMFSLGITMWQILNRESPYPGENEHSIIYKVVAQGLRPPADPMGSPYIRLCELCWDADPNSRPNGSELLDRLNYLQVHPELFESGHLRV